MNDFLVMETSSATGSWALFRNGACVRHDSFAGRASGQLAPSLLKIRDELQGLQGIVVGVGPGSFSGIRVGIAAAQGLAVVLQCPLVPLRSTAALAWLHRDQAQLGVFADARRQRLFFTAYAAGQLMIPSRLISHAEVAAYQRNCSLALSVDGVPGAMPRAVPQARDLGYAQLHFPPEKNLALDPIYLHGPVGS